MRYLLLFTLLVCCGVRSAWANGAETDWPGWTIASSEELSEGITYQRTAGMPLYPLNRMFDGDPKTAWVWSATKSDTYQWKTKYGLSLQPDKPLVTDGLRLMNGQNLSRERFLRNDRIVKMRVTLGNWKNAHEAHDLSTGKPLATYNFALPDTMGWHSVSWPKCKADWLKIEFTGIKRGQGPKSDVCLSELALLQNGQPLNMHMPRATMFYDGLEGCGARLLILADGTMLEGQTIESGDSEEWSPNGRYVSGYSYNNAKDNDYGKAYEWVADVKTGKVLHRITFNDYMPPLSRWTKGPGTIQFNVKAREKQSHRIIKLPF